MKNTVGAFTVGLLFALGLGLSGMTQPQKVVGFLDVFGNWDPSLLLVMVGATTFHFVTYRWIRRRNAPWFSTEWHVPTKRDITPALIAGSALFGIGWGLAGYCPGPAVTSLASLNEKPAIFVLSMLIGMGAFRLLDAKFKFRK